MAALVGLFVGAIVGKLAFGDWAAVLFAAAGFLIGALASRARERSRYRKPDAPPAGSPDAAATAAGDARLAVVVPTLAERVAALERRVAELEQIAALAPSPGLAARAEAPGFVAATTPSVAAAAAPSTPEHAVAAGADRALASGQPESAPAVAPAPRNPLWAWITGGNALARAGVLVLFVGVGFLLKYAAEHVSVPIELRLTGVALGAIVLLVVGWRLRERRTAYAMALQGGGVGVLYLTVFAAMKLYGLIPPLAAFALLFWVAALSSWLAIRQDAMALAAFGVLGGFAAPVLTSTSGGSHVLLFSYYALLNASILFVAWFRAWRVLNLLGFVCTFVVGTLWGVTRYRAELFASTEPFLVLFFLYYVGIAVLYAMRRSASVRDYVDGTLVFGTPLVAAALQHALVGDVEYAMAASAIAASALYVGLARWLYARRGDELRLLVESFVALGVAFATLAVPLALDARWTSGTWALEGAALVWVGARQQRLLPRMFGLVLQLAAGVAFAAGASHDARVEAHALAVLNSDYVGAALLALAGLLTAWVYRAHGEAPAASERALAPFVFAWGVLWWLGAAWREIERWVAPAYQVNAAVAFVAASAAGFALAAWRLRWPLARVPSALTLPALLFVALAGVVSSRALGGHDHLFAHGGWLAWPFAIAIAIALLHRFERPDDGVPAAAVDWAHAATLWLAALVATQEIAWAAHELIGGSAVWPLAAWGLAPAVALAGITVLASGARWPIGAHRRAYLLNGALPIAAWLVLWSLAANPASDGDPAPLPFLPLLNPLDLAQGFVLVALLTWSPRLRAEGVDLRAYVTREALVGVPAVLLFVWLNALALRTVHHAADVPYALEALWRSPLVQATLSLLWTGCALASMVWANRRGERAGWIAGAALLGVVVAKLFLVDLSRVGTIERIVSFIGVGLLLLLIGYLAPVPARKEQR
jgi:uncharacterized membrane protein